MFIEPGGVIGWVMIGMLVGAIATQFATSRGFGIGGDIGIGLAGGIVGGLAVSLLFQGQGGTLGSIFAAFLGALLLTKVARAVRPGRIVPVSAP